MSVAGSYGGLDDVRDVAVDGGLVVLAAHNDGAASCLWHGEEALRTEIAGFHDGSVERTDPFLGWLSSSSNAANPAKRLSS